MRLTCPCCGCIASVEAWLADSDARQVMALAMSLPSSLGPSLLRYLSLFRPAPRPGAGERMQRGLAWDRALKLLKELEAPIRSATLQRHGRPWSAPLPLWEAALEQVLAARDEGRLALPLKSHGYLYEIVVAIASKAEARAEAEREQQMRYPYARAHAPDAPPSRGIPESALAELRRFTKRKEGTDDDTA